MMSHEIRRPGGRAVTVLLSVASSLLLAAFAFSAGVELTNEHYTSDSKVTVDTGRLPSSDCAFIVGLRDDDGKPGGGKTTRTATDCP